MQYIPQQNTPFNNVNAIDEARHTCPISELRTPSSKFDTEKANYSTKMPRFRSATRKCAKLLRDLVHEMQFRWKNRRRRARVVKLCCSEAECAALLCMAM
ncbi:hypothetical protein M758_7G152000 [Ceratodon purpureus]|nr:hypothetical protein M758_7G152000 [Ceratodon purpureus]